MLSVKPPMYGSVYNPSAASTEKGGEDLAFSDLKIADLEACSATAHTPQNHQTMARQGRKMLAMVSQTVASAAAVVPPLRGGMSLLRSGTTDAVRNSVAVLQGMKDSRHIARSFAEVPLTAEGVTMLQNDSRVDREVGSLVGTVAGLFIGGVIGFGIFRHYGDAIYVSGETVSAVCGGVIGGFLGVIVGVSTGASPEKIRLNGLFYTGIVDSKLLSESTTSLVGRNAKIDRPAGEVTALLNRAVLRGKLSLTPEQIAGVETYYALAHSALRRESV